MQALKSPHNRKHEPPSLVTNAKDPTTPAPPMVRTKRVVAQEAEERLVLANGGCWDGAANVICGCVQWPPLSPATRKDLTQQARLADMHVLCALALISEEDEEPVTASRIPEEAQEPVTVGAAAPHAVDHAADAAAEATGPEKKKTQKDQKAQVSAKSGQDTPPQQRKESGLR